MLIDGGGREALVGRELVDGDDFADVEPCAAAGCALIEPDTALFEPLHRLAAFRAIERGECLAARTARVVGFKAAVAGTATTRRLGLLQSRVARSWVGDATRERVAYRPESKAPAAETERVDGLELVAPEGHQFWMVGAVGAGGPGRRWRPLRRLTAQLSEDLIGVALPGPGRGAGTGSGKPAFVGKGGHA